MATPEQELARDPRRRQLAIIGGLAILLLVLVWFFLLRGGDEPPAAAPAAAPAAPAQPAPQPSGHDDGGKDKGGGAVETFEVFASRDPFDPLVSDTSASSGGESSGSTSTFIGGGGGSGGSGNGSTGGGSGSGDGSSTVGGHRVRVVDVYRGKQGPTAQVEVDSTVYTASEGERFADNFQLVSASGQCATMLFGDDQFTLCEGEEILK
jgi:hypothetical protein